MCGVWQLISPQSTFEATHFGCFILPYDGVHPASSFWSGFRISPKKSFQCVLKYNRVLHGILAYCTYLNNLKLCHRTWAINTPVKRSKRHHWWNTLLMFGATQGTQLDPLHFDLLYITRTKTVSLILFVMLCLMRACCLHGFRKFGSWKIIKIKQTLENIAVAIETLCILSPKTIIKLHSAYKAICSHETSRTSRSSSFAYHSL